MEDQSRRASQKQNSSNHEKLHNYQLGKVIGSGSFSKVRLARHLPTGIQVAVKIVDLRKICGLDAERVAREIKILRSIAHPHVIRLYEVIETRTKTYMVLEYMKCGDLFDYITEKGYIQEDEGSHLFQQIISGVEFCHLKRVVHRDLKPENILLDSQRNAKIADFGLGNIMRDGHFLQTRCGSRDYAAPEIIWGELYAGPEVDVWSCGVVLYAILCGRLPFEADNLPALKEKLESGRFNVPCHLSPTARDLISRMLVVDPMKRITIPEILRHPWPSQNRLPPQLPVPARASVRPANEAAVTHNLLLDARLSPPSCCSRTALPGPSGSARLNMVSIPSVSPNSITSDTQRANHNLENWDYWQQRACGSKWAPGLEFQARPGEIMNAALRTLHSLNICWKSIGNYNMKCRWLPNFPAYLKNPVNDPSPTNQFLPRDPVSSTVGGADDIPSNKNTVKFEIQLYKARDNTYLLDLQRLHGSPFLFLEICLAFRDRLQLI